MDELDRRQAELAEAEQEHEALAREHATVVARFERSTARVTALRQVVEGLRALNRLERQPAREQLVFQATPPTPNGSAADTPRGREAVRRVLSEDTRDWRMTDLVAEIVRRGWIDPGARQPAAAIRVAAKRLADDGEAVKVRPGVYRYKLPAVHAGTDDLAAAES
jgi:hypothetical protein